MNPINDLNTASDKLWLQVCALAEITPNTGVAALLGEQQIALFRIGDRVYALSNQDPFSQAYVMSRGILGDVQGERVVASPLYKQHFSLSSGRCLEDPTQHLRVYPCRIENGQVWVHPTAKPSYPSFVSSSTEKQKLVLIGNGLAGMRCIEELLDMAPDRYQITVIGAEACGNYNRVLLSPVLSGQKQFAEIMLHSAAWYRQHHIRFIAADPAIKIDRGRKQVQTQSGQLVDYDRMILATGSTAFMPQIEGHDLAGVMCFRNIQDVEQMLDYSQHKKNAVVIGGGLLGLEAAYGLQQRGMQVTLLHLSDRLMDRQLDQQASALLAQAMRQKGISILTEADTQACVGRAGQVEQVLLKDGRRLDADLVVFAVGIRPNIALAQQAGLHCERGVLVNDTLQSFDPSIYAVGECIQHRDQTFGLVEPLWQQALVCASHLAERGSLSFKASTVPTQLKVSGIDVFSAGQFEPSQAHDNIILNDEKRQVYKRIILQEDKVIGAVLFGDTEDAAWYTELIAAQTPIGAIRHKLLFGKAFCAI